MKKLQKRKQRKRLWGIGIGIAALIVMLVTVVLKNGDKEEKEENPSAVMENEEETYVEETIGKENGIEISTPYGSFYYPKTWEEDIRIEESDGNDYSVTLYGNVNDAEVKIFTVFFEKKGNSGYLFGTIMDEEDKKINVSIEMADLVPDETWTEENTEKIYTMQEDVNYIIEQLYAMETFVPVDRTS